MAGKRGRGAIHTAVLFVLTSHFVTPKSTKRRQDGKCVSSRRSECASYPSWGHFLLPLILFGGKGDGTIFEVL